MLKKRYADFDKLITDIDKLELTDEREVLIYHNDKFYDDVFVYLDDDKEDFEKLKPFIAFLAENLWKLDMIAQRYDDIYNNSNLAQSYEAAYIRLKAPNEVSIEYYGMRENTEFDVVFKHEEDKFILKSFGMRKNIPDDWDKE